MIFLANGGTLSELELRVLYVCSQGPWTSRAPVGVLKKSLCFSLGLCSKLYFVFSCEAQLNTCTCALSARPSVRLSVRPSPKLNFSLFGQLMTTFDNL